ncbi:MAG TPA: hypothetical protein VN937_18140 [Blastocatellia bacterium]|nr:hypothetical protein [Blastocatellia bacterium]
MFKISLTIEAGHIPQGAYMKDWLREEIEVVKARCARAERKLDRRLLDDKVKQEQRPRAWAALVAELKESVEQFNESIKLPEPLVFSQTSDRAAVAKNDNPKCRLNIAFSEAKNDISFNYSEGKGSSGSIVFDVDDNGILIFLWGNAEQTIDSIVAMLLQPVFQCVC